MATSDPGFTIDGEAMKAVVQKAILDSLTDDQRGLIIEQAVTFLVTRNEKPKDRYASYNAAPEYEPSPLEVTFRLAVAEVAKEVVAEYVAAPDARQIIKDALKKHVDELVDADRGDDDATSYSGWLSHTISWAIADNVKAQIVAKKES